MDLQWILLALFLVAIVWGVTKSFSVSMLRNTLRLGLVVVSFLKHIFPTIDLMDFCPQCISIIFTII